MMSFSFSLYVNIMSLFERYIYAHEKSGCCVENKTWGEKMKAKWLYNGSFRSPQTKLRWRHEERDKWMCFTFKLGLTYFTYMGDKQELLEITHTEKETAMDVKIWGRQLKTGLGCTGNTRNVLNIWDELSHRWKAERS